MCFSERVFCASDEHTRCHSWQASRAKLEELFTRLADATTVADRVRASVPSHSHAKAIADPKLPPDFLHACQCLLRASGASRVTCSEPMSDGQVAKSEETRAEDRAMGGRNFRLGKAG